MNTINPTWVAQDFHRAAPRYAANALLQRRVAARLVEQARNHVPEVAKVLDAGCGTGFIAELAPAGWQMTQVDIAPAMCEIASRIAPVIQSDMCDIPCDDGGFDAVTSSLALQWVDQPERAFQEWARLLKPQGWLAFATLGEHTLQELRTVFHTFTGTAHSSDFQTEVKLKQSLAASGFVVEHWQETVLREQYPDLSALLHNLQAIGASNKQSDRQQRLTRAQLAALTHHYTEHYTLPEGGVFATWQVFYCIARKA